MKKSMRWVLLALILIFLCSCTPTAPVDTPTPDSQDKPVPDTPVTEAPSATTDNPLLNEKASANKEVLPRGMSEKNAVVSELKGKSLIMYYAAESDAFSYKNGKGMVNESAWLKRLAEKYDIRIRMIRKDPRSSLAAQRLALLSSVQLDILSFTPAQLPYAMGMTADATDLMADLQVENTDYLNQSVLTYRDGGNRFFTPAGVARNLWYTTGGSSNPKKLAESGVWDLQAFSNFVSERTLVEGDNVKVYGYEARDFADFMTALGTPMIAYDGEFSDGVEAAKDNLAALQQLNTAAGRYYNGQTPKDGSAPALTEGTLAMRYGQTPFVATAEKYPAFDWAPLPTGARHQGSGVVSACAPVLALPKDGPQNKAALCAALLWSARFADANHDLLRFTYGLSFESWTEYFHATNKQLQIVYTDESSTLNLRRLLSAPTFVEGDVTALAESSKLYCINANERLANDR